MATFENWLNRRKGKSTNDLFKLDMKNKTPKENIVAIFEGLYFTKPFQNEVSPTNKTMPKFTVFRGQQKNNLESRKLSYLNALVTLLGKEDINNLGFTTDELMTCIRLSLVDESMVLRAAALRVLRYLIRTESDVATFNNLRLPYLVARSIDLMLRNEEERAQALRVVRRVVAVVGSTGPRRVRAATVDEGLLRCLAAVARAGTGDGSPDRLSRPAIATLAEICVLNPELFISCGGVTAVTRQLAECATPRMAEALCGVLLHSLNEPVARAAAKIDLTCLSFPYCDFHFRPAGSDANRDEREMRFTCSRLALLCVLRSWPGLLHFCHPRNTGGLQAMVAALYLPRLEVRKAILDLLYELVGLPQPEWTDEISVALDAVDPADFQDSWRLNEGFVAAEGAAILPHLSATGSDITEIHLALLLQCFLEAGLLNGLAEVIVTSDTFISVRATVLLGQLLHLIHLLLPPQVCNITPALPLLMSQAASGRPQALAAVAALRRLHAIHEARPASHSLFLDHIIQYCSGAYKQRHEDSVKSNKEMDNANIAKPKPILYKDNSIEFLNESDNECEIKQRHSVGSRADVATRNVSALVKSKSVSSRTSAAVSKVTKSAKFFNLFERDSDNLIRCSLVMQNKDGNTWNWEIIRAILKENDTSILNLHDSAHKVWVARIINYLKPSSNKYSHTDLSTSSKGHSATRAGCQLIRHLLKHNDVDSQRLLEELFSDVSRQVEAIETGRRAHECLFSPQHMTNTMCQMYFLFIGQLCHSPNGLNLLKETRLYENLLELSTKTHHSCYVKLIISSLDYAQDSYPRDILAKTLTCNILASRLYATQFLNVLLRASQKSKELLRRRSKLKKNFVQDHLKASHREEETSGVDMDTWLLQLLVNQVKDESKTVVKCAVLALEEAISVPALMDKLVLQRDTLGHNCRLSPESPPSPSSLAAGGDRGYLVWLALQLAAAASDAAARAFVASHLHFWTRSYNYRYCTLMVLKTLVYNCRLSPQSPPSPSSLAAGGDRDYLVWLALKLAAAAPDAAARAFVASYLHFWTRSYNYRYCTLMVLKTLVYNCRLSPQSPLSPSSLAAGGDRGYLVWLALQLAAAAPDAAARAFAASHLHFWTRSYNYRYCTLMVLKTLVYNCRLSPQSPPLPSSLAAGGDRGYLVWLALQLAAAAPDAAARAFVASHLHFWTRCYNYRYCTLMVLKTLVYNCRLSPQSPPSPNSLAAGGDRGYLVWLALQLEAAAPDAAARAFVASHLHFWTRCYNYRYCTLMVLKTLVYNCRLSPQSPPSPSSLAAGGDRGYLVWLALQLAAAAPDAAARAFVASHLHFWTRSYNYRYVRLVESAIHDALALSEDSGGRAPRARRAARPPPHILHALTRCPALARALLPAALPPLATVLQRKTCANEQEIMDTKAALWAVGNVCLHPLGLQQLLAVGGDESVPARVIALVRHCAVYSVRATALYALGLIGSTYEGANLLSDLGWLCVRHTRHDQFPIIQDEVYPIPDEKMHNFIASPERRFLFDVEATELSDHTDLSESMHSETTKVQHKAVIESEDVVDKINFIKEPDKRKSHTLPTQAASSSHNRMTESRTVDILRDFSYEKPGAHRMPNENRLIIGRMNSLDHAHEGRVRNTSESSTSGVSSCDSVLGKYAIPDRVLTLSPIPSSSSLYGMKSSSSCHRPRLPETQRRTSSSSFTAPDVSSSPPSQLDMTGYATLISLNKHRRPHLSESAASCSSDVDDLSWLMAATQRRAKPFSSLRERAKTSRERAAKLSLLDYDWKPLCVESGGARSAAGPARAPPAADRAPRAPPPHYIGVCLPRDLAHIFPSDFTGSYGDYDTNDKEPTKMDKNSTLLDDSITGAEVKRSSKFVEVDVSSSTDVSRISSTARTLTDKNVKEDDDKEVRTEEAKEASNWRHAVNECLVCVRTRPPSSNELREAFFLGLEGGEEARRGGQEARGAPQAELLRHVRFMANPIYLRQTRSALLSIKQRHPEVFRSACVYSDVCAQLARDTYLLCARRFLHELFLDADFDCFRDEPANLLARHAPAMLPESVAN